MRRSTTWPAGRKKSDAGEELRQSDQAEVQWPLGDLVNLPADGNRLHLKRGYDAETGDGEIREVRVGERGASGPLGVNFGRDRRERASLITVHGPEFLAANVRAMSGVAYG